MSAGFPAQHEKAHITKDLHICQRFGAEGKGEALYYISKVQTQSWAFLAYINEVQVPEQTSLDSLPSTASFLVGTRISHKTGRGMERSVGYYRERSMDVMIGQLHWAVAAMLGLDQIIFFCVSNVAANAPKAFSSILLNSVCTGKSVI